VHDAEGGAEREQVCGPGGREGDRDEPVAGRARERRLAGPEAIDEARGADAHGQRRERIRHEEPTHGGDPVRQRERRHEGRHGRGRQASDGEHADHDGATAQRGGPALLRDDVGR